MNTADLCLLHTHSSRTNLISVHVRSHNGTNHKHRSLHFQLYSHAVIVVNPTASKDNSRDDYHLVWLYRFLLVECDLQASSACKDLYLRLVLH